MSITQNSLGTYAHTVRQYAQKIEMYDYVLKGVKPSGVKPSRVIWDDLRDLRDPLNFEDYEMVHIGPKHYGFRSKSGFPRSLTKTYRCSHIKAKEQFKVFLIACRLKT